MARGLAALTSGYMEGAEAKDKAAREKQVRELLGRESARLKRKGEAEGKDIERLYPGEFSFEQYTPPQTFGQKIGGWVKGLFKPEQQMQALPMQGLQAPPDLGYAPRTAEPTQYEDGGAVRHMVKKYANGGRSLGPHQGGPGRVAFQPYEHGGKAIEEDTFADDLKRNAAELLKGGFANTIEEALEMSRGVGGAQKEMVAPGRTPAQRGRSAGRALWETGKGLTKTAGGLYEDTGISKVGEFVGGMVGIGTGDRPDEQAAAVQAVPTETPPERVTEGIAPTGGPEDAGVGGGAAVSVGGGQARQAIPSTQEGEREIDFSTEAREVMPEDIPAHSSKDWEDERNYWAASAIMKGEDPFQAMKKVDAEQLNGFSRYAMQATALINADDLEGASRALYAAYQYFPNGKDVKFGVQKGKDGRRVIVAMGKDEESGEPSGAPQILNENTISRMVENMSKPGALRAWTTDWQATEAKLWEQGYKQQELQEKGRHARATEAGYEARTAAMGAGGGMKQADWDRAFGAFMESRELQALEDEPLANDLADVMTRLYQKAGPQTGYPSIIKAVLAAHADGSLDQLREQYGLQ